MEAKLVSGFLWFVMIAAVLLTIPLSFLLLSRYRQAVRHGMNSGQAAPEAAAEAVQHQQTLGLEVVPLSTLQQLPAVFLSHMQQRRRAVLRAYAIAGLLFAVALSFIDLYTGSMEVSKYRVLSFTLGFLVPQFFIFNLISSATGRQQWKNAALFFVPWLLLHVLVWWRASSDSLFTYLLIPLLFNWFPILVVLLLRIRSLRSASLLVMALMMVSVGGGFFFVNFLGSRLGLLEKVSGLLSDTGMGGRTQFYFLILLGMAGAAIVGWWVLQQLKKWYQQKQINDLMLAADSYMLLFTLYYSLIMFSYTPVYIPFNLLLLLLYKAVVVLLLKRIPKPATAPPALLLLRVFALGQKSSRLFQLLKTRWRFGGTIQLISGTDLAVETAEPHELLDFVAGNLKHSFCVDENSVRQNFEKADRLPDLDGCYRINEMMCTNSSWKMALQQLVHHSRVVLMDLRTFSARFQGCVYELQALVHLVPLSRCVFLIDATTDVDYLRSTLQQAFQSAPADSPNLQSDKPTALLYHFENGDDQKMEALMRLLCHKAEA